MSVALIGCGMWGKNLARNLRDLGVLSVICDPNPFPVEGVQVTDDLSHVIENSEITACMVASPATSHFEVAKRVLSAGKDCYVEKPLCLTEDEARELIDLAEREERVLMVGHLLQYHPVFVRLKKMVREGDLGDIHYIASHRMDLGRFRFGENALWNFAPHDISMILSLVDDEVPTDVFAQGSRCLTSELEDVVMTQLRFPSGVRAHCYVSWVHPFKEQKLVVVGSKGLAVFDDTLEWERKLSFVPGYHSVREDGFPVLDKSKMQFVEVAKGEPLREECMHFLDCCAKRRRPLTDGQEAWRVLQVLLRAQQCLEQSAPIMAS